MTPCPNCGGRDRHYDLRCYCTGWYDFSKIDPVTNVVPNQALEGRRKSSMPYRLPLEVGPRDVTYAKRRAAYLARQRVSVTDAVALLVPEVCSRERIWGVEDRDLIQAAVIDAYNRVRWAEVGR